MDEDMVGVCTREPAAETSDGPGVVVVIREGWLKGVAGYLSWHRVRRIVRMLLGCLLLAAAGTSIERRSPGVGSLLTKPPLTASACVVLSRCNPVSGLAFGFFGGLFTDAMSPGMPLGVSWLGLWVAVALLGARDWLRPSWLRRWELPLSCGFAAVLLQGVEYVGATLAGALDISVWALVCRLVLSFIAGILVGWSGVALKAGASRVGRILYRQEAE